MAIDRPAVLRQAEKLLRLGKLDQAIAEYVRLVEDQPQDWTTANALGDLYVRAGYVDQAVEHFTRIADGLNGEGFRPKAGALYKKILKLKPDDEHAMLQSAEIAAAAGLLADARTQLNAVARRRRDRRDQAGVAKIVIRLAALDEDDEPARLAGARARLEIGEREGALRDFLGLADHLQESDRHDPAARAIEEALTLLANSPDLRRRLAPERPALVFQAASRAADAAAAMQDFRAAAGAIQEFLGQVPQHVPALTRLVEIAVDGELDTAIDEAQARLVEGHLVAGTAAAARPIAEDLLARYPDDATAFDRLRRVLLALGETDPEATISALARPVVSEAPATDAAPPVETAQASEPPVIESPAFTPAIAAPPVLKQVPAPVTTPTADLAAARADVKRAGPEVRQRSKHAEVDLTVVLEDIRKPPVIAAPPEPPPLPDDIDAVFAQLRDETSRRSLAEACERDFVRGMALFDCGDTEHALAPLQSAARSPRLRFEAAAAIGRVCLSRGQAGPAIEWFGRAADAAPPSADAGHALLYELAQLLEAAGETARALAVCLELQADAGDYRDLSAFVTRLVKLQAHE